MLLRRPASSSSPRFLLQVSARLAAALLLRLFVPFHKLTKRFLQLCRCYEI